MKSILCLTFGAVTLAAFVLLPAPSPSLTPEEEVLPLLVVAKAKVKPEHRDAFVKAATACAEVTRKEQGNVSYRFYEDPNERASFLFFEEWKDQAAIDAHFKAPHLATFFATVQPCLAGPPDIQRYELKGRKKL